MKDDSTHTRIKLLLEAYYNGSASDAEVAELTAYFSSSPEVDPDFAIDKAIFSAMAKAKADNQSIPSDLRDRIIKVTSGRRKFIFRTWMGTAAAAATLAVLVAVGYHASDSFTGKSIEIEKDTYAEAKGDPYIEVTDSAEVAAITQMVFQHLDYAMTKANTSVRKVDEALSSVNQTLNNINL